MRYDVNIRVEGMPGLSKRQGHELTRRTFNDLGIYWHKKLRLKHFTHAGAREYKYTPRSGEQYPFGSKKFWASYTGRKKRRFGHTNPLQYTGLSKRLTRLRIVRPTRNGVKVVLRARAFNFRNSHSRINMRKEATTISDREIPLLEREGTRKAPRHLRKIRTKRRLRNS